MTTIQGKAAVLFAPDTPLKVVDVNFEPPKAGEVRVKMKATGICHSDLYTIKGMERGGFDTKTIKGPIIPGHEGSGIVESVGDGVTGVREGDHFVLLWIPICNDCALCKKPTTNLCLSGNLETTLLRKDGTSRVKMVEDGSPLLSLSGAFAEYIIVEEDMICKVPTSIPLDVAALVGCCVGAGYGTAVKIGQVTEGSRCAVWGMGAVGLCAILGCKAAGASKIYAVDRNQHKLDLALNMGATVAVNVKEMSEEKVLEELKGQTGLDYAFECTGNPDCLAQAHKLIAPWGTLLVVGMQPPGTKISVPAESLLFGQRVTGGIYGGYKQRDGNRILMQEIESGRLTGLEKLITHRRMLDKINEGFDLLINGTAIRTIIEM